MLFYRQIDLPQIPLELLDFDASMIKQVINRPRFDYGKDHHVQGRHITPPAYSVSEINCAALNQWLAQHLAVVPKVVYSQTTPSDSHQMLVHTDIKRIAALNYVIETGGDDVKTSWYQEQGQPIQRREKTAGNQTDSGYVDYENLQVLDSAVFKKHCWYLLRTNVLHDVTNLCSRRSYLGISYFKHSDLEFFGF